MLKKRIIPTLLFNGSKVVKGKQFTDYRTTGLASSSIRTFSAFDADEIAFINISDSAESIDNLIDVTALASVESFVPLMVGGGITTLDHVHRIFAAGADKVLINTAAYANPKLVTQVADLYGTQSVVVGIDYYETLGNKIAISKGTQLIDDDIIQYAIKLQDSGAGELFLNSIERDGMMRGLDTSLPVEIQKSITIPIIVCGGAGHMKHLNQLFNACDPSAIACSSLFHFGDNTPIRIRAYLRNYGVPMRVLK